MLHIRLHNSNVQHIFHVTIWRLCQFVLISYQWGGGEGGGLLIFGRGEGGVNANREVLQILDPQRLASLLGNLGISVRIHTQT